MKNLESRKLIAREVGTRIISRISDSDHRLGNLELIGLLDVFRLHCHISDRRNHVDFRLIIILV